ncbi:putative transposase, IS4 family [Candidatus Nitrososphaera gargensis Ga9.2]|uniref:Putative transposase, IS4 family n=2 Tax=Candidatus Nitrososphaera gargensis TaxID=497727 RepID=K0IGF0_NITGG|nr:putative transposase, IS4 family [Candidatus Nitrososphaera gargensis Ga9.2]
MVEKVRTLGIRIRYLTLDGGFFSIDTMRFLKESGLKKYILHMPSTRKVKKMRLSDGMRFKYRTNHHHHQRRELEQVSFDVVVAYDRTKDYYYLMATNMPSLYKSSTLLKLYNRRWGIETSYRMCNQFLIRTTSKKYIVRLFYYLFACLIYNAWVTYNEQNIPVIVVQMKLSLLWFVLNDNYMLEYA